MTIEEMFHGESKNIEFKVMLPKNSEKYVKTIIAFANTQGGQLVIGVDDESGKVVGVDKDAVFDIMDAIANAVSDSCTPQIVPDITLQTIEGKSVVVASVVPGAGRPYFLKTKGREKGTFVRVAGTSRLADAEKIKQLEYEGHRISWDEQICIGCHVTEQAVKKLCRDMNRYRKEIQERRDSSEKMLRVTRAQLLNWDVIRKSEEGYQASNAFALLSGRHFHYSKTQCAVFAGTERGEFLDKKEFDGPLYEQIEESYAFVLRNIRLRARVEGLIRRERYELPPAAIREMIINAHCHRNFLDPSCVQVAIYDDRLEVTSPGGLYFGLTLKEAVSGRSKQRNRVVAEVFNQMGLIEAWGTGLKNIRRWAMEYHLPEPDFIEMEETFRVNLYRNLELLTDRQIISSEMVTQRGDYGVSKRYYCNCEDSVKFGESSVKFGESSVNETKRKILEMIRENNHVSAAIIADRLSISVRSVEKNIRDLREIGILMRHGAARGGYWEIMGK